ncbi:MAG: glycosyltransferase, partial [Candidatus Adiutrix sp.]
MTNTSPTLAPTANPIKGEDLTGDGPFFSIITATFNAETELPQLLESLAAQTFESFELILQDGASSDNTVQIAENYRHRLPALHIKSEVDTGIYDAWNKAVTRANGQWLVFLGADDSLHNIGTLKQVWQVAKQAAPPITFIPSWVQIADKKGHNLYVLKPSNKPAKECLPCCRIPAPFTSLFIKKQVCDGRKFDPSYTIV